MTYGAGIHGGGGSLGSTVEVAEMESLSDGEFIVGDGSGAPAKESGNDARTSLGLGTGDQVTFTRVTAVANSLTQPSVVVAGTNTGLGFHSSGNMLLHVGGAVKLLLIGGACRVPSNSYIGWDSATSGVAGPDTAFDRNDAGVIEANNGTNGEFRDLITRAYRQSGANGQEAVIQHATAEATVDAGATFSFSNLIPAGSLVLGVTIRVTTAITSGDGGSSFAIGDGSDVDRWGTGIAFDLDTTTDGSDFTTTFPPHYPSATSVVLTVDSGTFSGTGVVRCTVHYISLVPATS